MADYTIRTTRLTVCDRGDAIFAEGCTHVSIDDDCAGEYVAIEQSREDTTAERDRVTFNPTEWPFVAEAVGLMLEEIERNEKREKPADA